MNMNMTVAQLRDAINVVNLRDKMKREMEQLERTDKMWDRDGYFGSIGNIIITKADLACIIAGRQNQIDTLNETLEKLGIKD